ncbi:hypothetical protein OSTOST_11591 [Ostertagia ostertagi]
MKWPAIVASWLIAVTGAVIDNDYNSLEDDVMEISHSSETHHKPVRFRNCTRDTDIIDQLLNGTGYNKSNTTRRRYDRLCGDLDPGNHVH